MRLALCHCKIEFDKAVVVQKGIDGAKLAQVRSEKLATSFLGIPAICDATRTVALVNHIKRYKALPGVISINADGDPGNPARWSVKQFNQHAENSQLRSIARILKVHKFAGDILESINVEVAAFMLNLHDEQEIAFAAEIEALRERNHSAPHPSTDATPAREPHHYAPGSLTSLFAAPSVLLELE